MEHPLDDDKSGRGGFRAGSNLFAHRAPLVEAPRVAAPLVVGAFPFSASSIRCAMRIISGVSVFRSSRALANHRRASFSVSGRWLRAPAREYNSARLIHPV